MDFDGLAGGVVYMLGFTAGMALPLWNHCANKVGGPVIYPLRLRKELGRPQSGDI